MAPPDVAWNDQDPEAAKFIAVSATFDEQIARRGDEFGIDSGKMARSRLGQRPSREAMHFAFVYTGCTVSVMFKA